MEYTIAAYPTKYKGTQYRSRLEARWAAFFDLLDWTAAYEPFDLGKWSPDFLLKGRFNRILVEVKPITRLDEDVAEKMRHARQSLPEDRRYEYDLLLVGVAPFIKNGLPYIGWFLDDPDPDGAGRSVWESKFKIFQQGAEKTYDFDYDTCPDGALSGFNSYPSYTNIYRADILETPYAQYFVEEITSKWADASNQVQWHPKGEKR